jgi:arylsulfatase A-like enzyme
MHRTSHVSHVGGLAAGATFGGLVVGLAEGLYRHVDLAYAALLYGAIWAIVASLMALALGRVTRRPPNGLLTAGIAISLGLSLLVLGRFTIYRDIYLEVPGKALPALFIALALSSIAVIPVLMFSSSFRKHFIPRFAHSPGWWTVPVATVVLFGFMTLTGDDDVAVKAPDAHAMRGQGVVLVVVDALRADMLGAYGAPKHRDQDASPAFDAWAAGGRRYSDMSAQASWTKPCVASLLTARHVSGHDTMSKVAVLPEGLPTIASVLHDAGIKTAAVQTNYNLEQGYGFDHGFDTYEYLPPARYLGAPARANRLAAYSVYRMIRERLPLLSRESKHFYRDGGVVAQHAFKALEPIGNDSFLLYLHYMDAHDPYFAIDGSSYARVATPHPDLASAPDLRDAYRDGVRRWDDFFAELLRGLEARGLKDRVLVIVTADHGEEFAEHGGFWHGTTLYEEQLHVPFVMAGDGVSAAVDSTLARQIDIAPTVLGFYGVTAPASWEGRNLRGDGEPVNASMAEEDHEGNVLSAVRQGTRKLILANDGNPRGLAPVELYSLASDPGETQVLHDDVQADALRMSLDRLRSDAKRGGAASATRPVDAAVEAELRALGVVK